MGSGEAHKNGEQRQDFSGTCLFFGVVLASVLLGHRLHVSGFKYATEGSVALLLGAVTGEFHHGVGKPRRSRAGGRGGREEHDVCLSTCVNSCSTPCRVLPPPPPRCAGGAIFAYFQVRGLRRLGGSRD